MVLEEVSEADAGQLADVRAVVDDHVEAPGRALARDAVEEFGVLLPAPVEAYAARGVFDVRGVEVDAGDDAALEVVALEEQGAALEDAEFEQAHVPAEGRAEVLLVVAQVVRVRRLVRVVLLGVELPLRRSHVNVRRPSVSFPRVGADDSFTAAPKPSLRSDPPQVKDRLVALAPPV